MKIEPLKNVKQNSGILNWLHTREILKGLSTRKYLGFLLGRSHKAEEKKIGLQIEKKSDVKRPRAWVIRLPSGFLGMTEYGGFQTVVMAANADSAWEVAAETDSWEMLDFDVDNVMVFPKDPR